MPCVSLFAQTGRGSGAVVGDFSYYWGSDDGVVCSGFLKNGVVKDTLKIPEEIEYYGKKYKVTEIGAYAFNRESRSCFFRAISLPKTIKRIGDHAFSQFPIGNDVAKDKDFLNCDTIKLPESLEEIGEGAFAYGNYKYVSIPKNVNKINYGAFAYCDSLKGFEVSTPNYSLIHPSGYTILTQVSNDMILQVCGNSCNNPSVDIAHNVESLAFSGCRRLKQIKFVYNTEYIGQYAFASCDSLEVLDFSENKCSNFTFGNYNFKNFYEEGGYYKGSYHQPQNYLYKLFGDFKMLKRIVFNEQQLPSNVFCKDGIFYLTGNSSDAKRQVAYVLFTLPIAAKDTIRFASVTKGETTYEIGGAKYGAFGSSIKDVYFETSNNDLSDNNIDIDYDSRDDNSIWYNQTIHVPYKFTCNAPKLKWFYDDYFNDSYKTVFFEHPFIMPKDVEGAVISGVDNNQSLNVDYQYECGEIVPANTGLLLKKNENATWNAFRIEILNDDAKAKEVSGKNYLRGYASPESPNGSDHPIESKANELYYMLSYDKNHQRIGFFWGAENGQAFRTHINRAYLALPSTMAADLRVFSLDGNKITGIYSVRQNSSENQSTFSLDGRKLQGNRKMSGIYIVNGQKTMIK